eukprot:25575-Pelagococcus_subviridis.AAC.1
MVVHAAVRERLVRLVPGRRQLEQRVPGVEHLSREEDVPLARQTARVDALLAAELNREPPAHLRGFQMLQLRERVHEHLLPVDGRAHAAVVPRPRLALREILQLRSDVRPLVIEVDQPRLLKQETQGVVQQRRLRPHERVDDGAVLVGEIPKARRVADAVLRRVLRRPRRLRRRRRDGPGPGPAEPAPGVRPRRGGARA